MDGGELFVMVVSVVLTGICWGRWLLDVARVRPLGARRPARSLLLAAPAACTIFLFVVLRTLASADVRDSALYLAFYLVFGLAWIGAAARLISFLGLSARDDVLERANDAAAWAISGALVGVTTCFAGANIGDGPGWWVVVFSGTLSTGVLALLWRALNAVVPLAERITVGRDLGAGVRAGALLAGAGLVLGRAAAGDWVSSVETLKDFAAVGWPAAAIVAAGALGERFAPRAGALGWVGPSLLYVAAAAATVGAAGMP